VFLIVSMLDLEMAMLGDGAEILNLLPLGIFSLLFLSVVCAFAHDIERQTGQLGVLRTS
jgi:hypothetical protein